MARRRVEGAAEMAPGSMRRVEADGVAVCLVRTPDGAFYAIGDDCTHEGAPLSDGELLGDRVECPMHGSLFDVRTGAVRGAPALIPARTYAVTVEGRDVHVDL